MANLINGFYQVNVGTNPNDGTGDSFRDCFIATNVNWGVVGNAGLANTALVFANSTISAPAGNSINFVVEGAYVNLGNAGSSIVGDAGNVRLGNGLTGQFLRASDTTGNIYWSGGASGTEGAVQYNQSGAFGAQSTFVYTESNARLAVGNLSLTRDAAVGGNLTVAANATIRDLSGGNFHFSGDGVVIGNFTVLGNLTSANATSVDIGSNLITLANSATSIVLLDQAGISWGNSAIIGTVNTPNIRFRDIGGSNIQQTVLSIYPGTWTKTLYVSASATPVAANLAPGYITFAPDTRFVYENASSAAQFSNLQAAVFNATTGNVANLTANSMDIATRTSDGSATAGRLLRIRNNSTPAGNVGLQIVNQSGGANAAWDLFNRASNGTLTFGYSSAANGTGSNIKLEVSNTGNVQMPYSESTDSFIGFGPGNSSHAGLRYSGIDYTLFLEATGAIDQLQLSTDNVNRVTVLGNTVPATAGFVGINNETPVSQFTVTGSTDGNRIQSGLTISRNGAYYGAYTLGIDNVNDQFFIGTGEGDGQGTTKLVIDSVGRVGMNLSTPTAALDVAGGGRFRTSGTGNNQALILYANTNQDTVNLQFANSSNANVWAMGYRQQANNGDLWIYQNESGADIKHLTLKRNTASVGINETSPRANLHVSSGAAGVQANVAVQSPGGAELALTAYSGYGAVGTANNFPLALQVNGVNVMTFGTDGATATAGNVTAGYFIGNGALLTGINVGTSYSNSNVANYLVSNSAVTILTTSNITTAANVQGAYVLGNGAFLSGIPAGYSNTNAAAYLASNAAVTILTTSNITTAANVKGSYLLGNGAYITGLPAGYTNSDVASYLASNSAVTVLTTGAITSAANITGSYLFGNGAYITGLPASYSNTNVASYLSSNSSTAIVTTGNITGGNLTTTGIVTAGSFYTTGPTTSGTSTVNGDLNVSGNINITGNLNYANVNSLTINDPMIFLGANNTGNLVDLGTVVTYNDGVAQYGGWVRDATDGTWKLFGNVTTLPGTTVNFANAIYQPMRAGAITATAGTFSLTLNVTGNTAVGNLSTAGSITGVGNITSSGNVQGAYILGNGAFLTGLPAGYSNAEAAAYLASNSSVTILTTGNITSSANVRGSYILGNGAFLTGLYSNTNAATYLASNAAVTILTTGNITTTANVQGGYILGNGAFLTGLPAGYSNTNAAAYLASNSAVTILTTSNITTAANVQGSYILGNGSQLTGLNFTNYSNTNAAAYLASNSSVTITTTGNVTAGNIISRGSISGSFAPRVNSSVSLGSALTFNSDSFDVYAATSQASNLVISADSGSPVDGRKIIFRITADGTARTLTFTGGVTKGFKPVGTVLTANGSSWNYTVSSNKTTYFGALYNNASGRWEIVALSQEV